MIKKCIKCETDKHIVDFNVKTRSKDGYDNTCRECINLYKSQVKMKVSLIEKVCSACKLLRPASMFNKQKGRIDGHRSICRNCTVAADKRYREQNHEEVQRKSRLRDHYRNLDSRLRMEKKRQWKLDHPEEVKEMKRQKGRDRYNRLKLEGRLPKYVAKPAYERSARAKRKAAQAQRTPSWLTTSGMLEIKEIYKSAVDLERETGVKYHVDHIYPLRGEYVSGLHVPLNLQVITADENMSKGNDFTPWK